MVDRKRSSRRNRSVKSRSHHHHHRYQQQPLHPPLPPPNSCKTCCKRFTAFLFSHVGLGAIVVGYTLLGAVTFGHIEGKHGEAQAVQVESTRDQTVLRLWNITVKHNVLNVDNWTIAVNDEIKLYQSAILQAVAQGYDGKDRGFESQWSFPGAFLYSLTVITTIGYGNIAPKTRNGRLATILYALVGIPLMLLYLSNIGDILAKAFKYVYSRVCMCTSEPRPGGSLVNAAALRNPVHRECNNNASGGGPSRRTRDAFELKMLESQISERSTASEKQRVAVPITLCMFIIAMYICAGMVLFSEWEGWSYLDGAYFCFVTLSTIGFGDLVPGDTVVSQQSGAQVKLAICAIYLLTGLALIAMCFNLVQEEVTHKMRNVGKRLGVISDTTDDDSIG